MTLTEAELALHRAQTRPDSDSDDGLVVDGGSSDDGLVCEEIELSPAELARLRAGADESDDDLVCEEVRLSPAELAQLKSAPAEDSSDDDLVCEEARGRVAILPRRASRRSLPRRACGVAWYHRGRLSTLAKG